MTEETDIQFNNTEPRSIDVRPKVSFGRIMILPTSSVPLPSYVGSPGYGREVSANSDECGASRVWASPSKVWNLLQYRAAWTRWLKCLVRY